MLCTLPGLSLRAEIQFCGMINISLVTWIRRLVWVEMYFIRGGNCVLKPHSESLTLKRKPGALSGINIYASMLKRCGWIHDCLLHKEKASR